MMARRFSLQVPMGSEPGPSEEKILVDEYYPTDVDDETIDVKKIENIRSNVKFDQHYEITRNVGEGKFGKVFLVKDKVTGMEYAAKFIRIKAEAQRDIVEREVSILTSLRHPRIARIYDAFYTTTRDIVLIMEIVRGGELFDRVADDSYVLTEQAVAMIICQLCEAIGYIHGQNILHLDIKPENIMCVTQKGNRIKLIDFGLARYYDGTQELRYMAGTPEFAAPEVIKFEDLTYYTDMWSVGVITYILLSGYSPFQGENYAETYWNVEQGKWEFVEEFDTVSEEAKDFISKLLILQPKKRMLPADCLVHPWIAKHRAKTHVDAILEKPAEGEPIDNKLMKGYNAKRKFRRMVIYVKFLIEMNRLRNSLRERKSENAQKFFEPLLKLAEEKEKKLTTVANALGPKPKPALGTLVEASLTKKRASLPATTGGEPAAKTEKPAKVEAAPGELPPARPKSAGDKVMVKTVTKTIVDPVTGETKTVIVKKKSVKKTAPDDEKKTSVKRKESGKEKKEETSTTPDRPAIETPAPAETPKKKKSSVLLDAVTTSTLPPITSQETPKRKSLTTPKILAATDSTSSSTSVSPAPSEAPKKKSVVLDVPPVLPKQSDAKFNSLLDVLKKRRSLPADLPSIQEPKEEVSKAKKQSLVTTTTSVAKDTLPSKPLESVVSEKPKKKSLASAELPPVQPKVVEAKEMETSTLTEVPKKKKSVVVLAKIDHPDTDSVKSETLSLPKVGKKTQKSDSSDSTKENRSENEVKKPSRQGALKKKEKLDDNVLNIITTRKSVDSGISVNKKEEGDKTGESVLIRKRMSLKSTGEKDLTQETKAEVKNVETPRESIIKAKLSKLNNEAAPLTMNIMSVAQKTHIQEKKPSVVINMIPEKTTTTTTSTTTSVRRKASTTEKKVQLTTQGKTVEQVELTNSTHDKVKVSQITTKKEESPELEAPLTSVKKKVVKQNTLKSQSEKNRKEEEKTKDGSLVQVTKVLNDKTLNHVAVNEHTTLPNGATKRISLSTATETCKKIEGKAEAEITPKKLSIKKAELALTEKTKSTLGSDINGNKTTLQKAHKTEIKVTPSTPTKDDLVKLEFPQVSPTIATSQKRGSILVVPKLKSRENSDEHKTVRFSKDVRDPSPIGSRAPSGLLKMNSESCLNRKVQSSIKVEETLSRDDGELRKKKKTLLSSKSQDVYTPKEDFSFNSLKEKLLRRVSCTAADVKTDTPREVLVSKTHSVKDRLRQFENKKL